MSGKIAWVDLTVDAAEDVKAFYESVLGWRSEPVSMGSYDDFNMFSQTSDDPVAGVCHARGENASLPPHWMIYVTVDDLEEAMRACEAGGGRILRAPSEGGRSCIIEDPAGAVLTLYRS